MKRAQAAPAWLEEPLIQRLLHSFIDKLERGAKPSVRVSAKATPELYDFQEDVDFLWALVESLDKDYQLITVKRTRVKNHQPLYEGAQLWFLPEAEEQVRQWLQRPALDPYALVWQKRLEKVPATHPAKALLAEQVIRIPELGAEQTLQGLLNIEQYLNQPLTLRQLSARCFRGYSKVLDRHEAWVQQLYPHLAHWLQPRPLLLTAYVPASFSEILFVENQDTFVSLAAQLQQRFALVYSAGFALSAERCRQPGQAIFAYTHADQAGRASFEALWFNSENPLPIWFWGDLDFAGMAILRALRASFPSVGAWQPGYSAMLQLLNNDGGYSATSPHLGASFTGAQQDPGNTGCEFADSQLLPAIRRNKSFIDQEAVELHLDDC